MPLTSISDIVGHWKEYVKGLLNRSMKAVGSRDFGVGPSISGVEVAEVVERLSGCNIMGVNKIHFKFLKVLDTLGCLG